MFHKSSHPLRSDSGLGSRLSVTSGTCTILQSESTPLATQRRQGWRPSQRSLRRLQVSQARRHRRRPFLRNLSAGIVGGWRTVEQAKHESGSPVVTSGRKSGYTAVLLCGERERTPRLGDLWKAHLGVPILGSSEDPRLQPGADQYTVPMAVSENAEGQ